MFEQKKLAVLIDSDNISAEYAPFIMQEVEKYGIPTYKRVYGDWRKGGVSWHNAAINYSLMPVQQSSYIAGKNATDFSMIIDAMDILYSGSVDGFCLVTSDSDFTRLAIRLREAGMLVVGIGELKTPRAFTVSCHHFCYLNQVCESVGLKDEKTIRREVLDYIEENSGEADLAKISAMLVSRFGNINFSEYGYKRISSFIDSFSELKRSNTFVTLKKKKTVPTEKAPIAERTIAETAPAPQPEKTEPAVIELKAANAEDIATAIREYLKLNADEKNNLSKIELMVAEKFGTISADVLGTRSLAKFIDRQPDLERDKQNVRLISGIINVELFATEVESYAKEASPNGGNAGQLNNCLISKYGKEYVRNIGFSDFRSALDSVEAIVVDNNLIYLKSDKPTLSYEEITPDKAAEVIKAYAEANAPEGGNVGQLNNELMAKFGRNYCADLGFADYKSLLSSMSEVYVKRNRVYLAIVEDNNTEQEQITEKDESSEVVEVSVEAPEKPDMNTVKRDVLNFAANAEDGGKLSELGKVLADKYGKSFLKEMGYTSMRKLAAEVNGIVVRNNKVYIDEAFAKQTEEIEQFVIEFANSEGKRTVRALGIQLRQKFEGFDFKNYGFARFTDFVNAIDGVKADRYHINVDDTEE